MICANLALRREESEKFKCTSYLCQHELRQWSVSIQTTFINTVEATYKGRLYKGTAAY